MAYLTTKNNISHSLTSWKTFLFSYQELVFACFLLSVGWYWVFWTREQLAF